MQARSSDNFQGIDISHYEQGILYDDITAQGKKIVYMKASEGSTGPAARDAMLGTHNAECRNRGLQTGPFHFLHLYAQSTVEAQAANFLAAITGQSFSCPISVDCENGGYHDNLNPAAVTAQVLDWADRVSAATGVPVIVYSNTAFFKEHFTSDAARLRLWIADYRNMDAPGDNGISDSWIGYQYSSQGTVGGMTVDLDEFTLDIVMPAWNYGGTPVPTPPPPAPAPQPAPGDPDVLGRQQGINLLHITDDAGQKLVEDGLIGPKTIQAYKRLQSIAGLQVDGIWGPKTQGAIDSILARPLLSQGSTGIPVRYIQWRVAVTIDGIFGPNTAAAVKSWQSGRKIAVDGIVGPNTWNTIIG